jgi:hypothetical protein
VCGGMGGCGGVGGVVVWRVWGCGGVLVWGCGAVGGVVVCGCVGGGGPLAFEHSKVHLTIPSIRNIPDQRFTVQSTRLWNSLGRKISKLIHICPINTATNPNLS